MDDGRKGSTIRRMASEAAVLAWLNLTQTHAALRLALNRAIEREAGAGLAEVEVLRRLDTAPDARLRMSELADRVSVAPSGMTRLVDRLVERGWVERDQPSEDRRSVYARITDDGRSLLHRAAPVYVRTIGEGLAGPLGDADMAELRRLLRLVLEGLGRWDDERCDAPADVPEPRLAGSS